MSEQELAPEEKRPTAAELKAQIEEKQRELNAEATVSEPAPALEPAVPTDPASAAPASILDKPTEPGGSSPEAAPAPASDKAELVPELVKKKGWKDVDSFLKSYAELEKKIGQKQAPQPPVTQFPPNYGAPPYYGYPSVPPVPRPGVAEIAQRYNLDPQDLERVAPLIADLSETIAEKKLGEFRKQWEEDRNARIRKEEIDTLKANPAFQNPDVLSEMGQILESQPQLAQQVGGLTQAFKDALASIGLKRLEGSAPTDAKPSGPVLPKTPPTTARGTGPTTVNSRPGIAAPTQVNPANFHGLPLAEKQKVLKAIGAIRNED